MEDIIQETVDTTEVDYVEAIKELKENSVSKAEYAKLKAENQKLIKSLINGESLPQDQQPKKEIDVVGIEKRLASKDPTIRYIDGFKMMLDLREADLAAGKVDPFIPATKRDGYTQADLDACQRRAEIYQECLDEANGNNEVFISELYNRMVDTMPTPPKGRK